MAQIPASNCGFCENAIAVLYCTGCHQILCVECKQNVHDKVPFLKNHEVVDINKDGNRVFRPIPVCEIHKSTFRYYCNKCDCLTCEDCMTSIHNEHKTLKIKNVSDNHRKRVNEIIDFLKTKVEVYGNKLKIIDTEHYSKIDRDCESYISKIEETAGELNNIIDRNKRIYRTTASDFKEIEKIDLNKQRSFFQRLFDETADRILKFTNLVQEAQDVIFFSDWKTLKTDVEIINGEIDQPIMGPNQMKEFDIQTFKLAVIEEIDEHVILRLNEQEQTVLRLAEDMGKLKNELKEKQEQIDYKTKLKDQEQTVFRLTEGIGALQDELGEKQERISKLSRQLNEKEKKVTELLDENDKLKIALKERQLKKLTNQLTKAEDNCLICMESNTKPHELTCGYIFCKSCVQELLKVKPVCPTCGSIQGVIKGDQPAGTMKRRETRYTLPGFTGCGTIEIEYDIYKGVQGEEHPNPGKSFKGIKRVAYLPNNTKGKLIADLLRIAFDRKLVFTIGHSRTTGQEGVVTWNDIHHKTSSSYGHQFGYPDEGYFDRVLDELKIKGVTEKDL